MTRPISSLIILAALLLVGVPVARAESEHAVAAAAEFQPEGRELQIILRLNPDELSEAMSTLAHRPMTLQDPDAERATHTLVEAALQMMNKDGELLTYTWVGMHVEPTWTFVVVEFPIPRETDGLQISNRLYFDRHDDQENVLNVKVGNDETTLTFTKDHPWKPIDLPAGEKRKTTPIPEVVTQGHGPIQMVLIPTHNCDASMFDAFMRRNADRYTMHALTLPGVAGTNPPPPPLPAEMTPWIDNAVEATAKAINDLDLDRPVILGSGLGGIIAYRLGIDHPDLVGPIITLDAMPAMMLSRDSFSPDQRRMMINKVTKPNVRSASDEIWQAQLRKLADSIVVREDRRAELLNMFLKTAPDVSKEYLIEHMILDLSDRMARIQSPVLAIAALNNINAGLGITAEDLRKRWESELAKARATAPDRFRIVYFEDTGPFITEERPKKLDAAVASFLKDVE